MKKVVLLSIRFAATLLTLSVAVDGFVDSASALQEKFAATLSGSNELPPINSHGLGVAKLSNEQ